MTPDTGAFDEKVVVQAMTAVFEKAGDGVLITHSAGGGPGWGTAMASNHVKGVIALEPGTFPFPEGDGRIHGRFHETDQDSHHRILWR